MGPSSGVAGLKRLQTVFRSIQLTGCLTILAIFSYYLATLSSNGLQIRTGVYVVEGFAAIGALYTTHSLLLLFFRAGYVALSPISLALDACFAIIFIYVAVENRAASGGCVSGTIYTVYGAGEAGWDVPQGPKRGLQTPTFGLACRLMMVCLIVSCLVIPVFLFSLPLKVFVDRTSRRVVQPDPIHDADSRNIGFRARKDRASSQRGHGFRGLRSFGSHSATASPTKYSDTLRSDEAPIIPPAELPPRYSEGDLESPANGWPSDGKHGNVGKV